MKLFLIVTSFLILSLVGFQESFSQELSLKEQIRMDIEPRDMVCKEGFQLISKPFRENPSCVSNQTAQKLITQGWYTDLNSISFFTKNFELWENSSCINISFIEHLIFAFEDWAENAYSTEISKIDYDGMSICEAENYVRNNLDDQFTIVGEMESGIGLSVHTLPPHNSVWIDLILKDETKTSLEKNDKYRLEILVSNIVKVTPPTNPALIWNAEKGWEKTKSPLKE